MVLGDSGAIRRVECIPYGAAEAVRVLSLSRLVVKFTCAHLCGCLWSSNNGLLHNSMIWSEQCDLSVHLPSLAVAVLVGDHEI